LGLFLLVAVLPIAFSLFYAAAYSVGLAGYLSEGFTFAHWQRVFSSSEIWISLGLSCYLAALSVLLTAFISLFFALVLRKSLQRSPVSYLIYLPLALPATVVAFVVFQSFTATGYLPRVLLELGWITDINQFPEIVHDSWGIGIVLAHLAMAVPFFVILFGQLYTSERLEELGQLATTLGAGPFAIAWRINIPVLLRKSYTNLTLLFIFVLGSYEIPLLLGRQSPQMISVLTMRKYAMYDLTEKPEAFIIALLYAVFVLVLTALLFRKGAPDAR